MRNEPKEHHPPKKISARPNEKTKKPEVGLALICIGTLLLNGRHEIEFLSCSGTISASSERSGLCFDLD